MEAFERDLIPAFDRFKPQFMLVSAGFDAHQDDDMSDILVSSQGFSWMMRTLMELAHRHANGRLVSVLEGGYALERLPELSSEHLKILLGDLRRRTDQACRFRQFIRTGMPWKGPVKKALRTVLEGNAMLIDRCMTRKVITIRQDDVILAAREKILEFKIGALPVVLEDQVLAGIVTDRDLRSALPSGLLPPEEIKRQRESLERITIKDIMTKDVVTVSPFNTLGDALVLILRTHVSTLPVVDREKKVVGVISIRDILRAFSEFLGINQPGTLLCVLAEDRQGEMKRIVDAITEEGIRFGSVLVARHWEEGKKAFFPYLFTNNVIHIRHKLESMGFSLPTPMEWYLSQSAEPLKIRPSCLSLRSELRLKLGFKRR